jgi:transposase-like protein
MTPEQQEIQSLKKQLWRAKRDNEILKVLVQVAYVKVFVMLIG